MSETLGEFLAARFDEDEAQTYAPEDLWLIPDVQERKVQARKLREVEAKRKILAEHSPVVEESATLCGAETAWDDVAAMATEWPCATIRALAAVYSDHPDYDADAD